MAFGVVSACPAITFESAFNGQRSMVAERMDAVARAHADVAHRALIGRRFGGIIQRVL